MNKKRLAIAGAGGIGAYLANFLYDYGLTRSQFPFSEWSWTVFDDDTVDTGNLLHQNFGEEELGRYKAEIVSERTGGIIRPELRFMTALDFPAFDVIFSCVDSMTFRRELYAYGFNNPELYWIDGRCSSRNIGVFNSRLSPKILKPTLSDSDERRGCLIAADKQNKISHVTPVIVAGIMAQTFLNHERNEDTSDQLLLVI